MYLTSRVFKQGNHGHVEQVLLHVVGRRRDTDSLLDEFVYQCPHLGLGRSPGVGVVKSRLF